MRVCVVNSRVIRGVGVCGRHIACVHRGVQPVASRRIGRISGASPRAAAACRMIRMCGAWCGGPGDPVACASRVVLVVPGRCESMNRRARCGPCALRTQRAYIERRLRVCRDPGETTAVSPSCIRRSQPRMRASVKTNLIIGNYGRRTIRSKLQANVAHDDDAPGHGSWFIATFVGP